MRVRVDESREDPTPGQVVQRLDPGGSLHPVAERSDLAILDEEIARQVHTMLRVEQTDAGKKESFGGKCATGKPRRRMRTDAHP